jgi:hypothetical protein
MAKVNGLNVRLYVAGKDMSGSANALDSVGYTNGLLDVVTLNSPAMKRISGVIDGSVSVNGWFDTLDDRPWAQSGGKLPTTDVNVLIPLGASIGDASYGIVSKEADYNVSSGDVGGAISMTSTFTLSNGYAPDFGVMLTAHDDTHGSATTGTAVDQTAGTTAGSTAVLQVFAVASGTAVIKVQHSTNNSSWADLITFTGATGATSQFTTTSGTVNRYIRASSTGTFSNCQFAVGFARS